MKLALFSGFAAMVVVVALYGVNAYYDSPTGRGCASCHEMNENVSTAHAAAHRKLACTECHESHLLTNLRHVAVHVGDRAPDRLALRHEDVLAMTARCQACHRQEYATWAAGKHSATYKRIFTDKDQNSKRRLMDDCFRCHGMHFQGAVRDLVKPLDTKGPWELIRTDMANQPTMPCIACHSMHREGAPITKTGPAAVPSLAFYDRRERMYFGAASMSIPHMLDGTRLVKMSPDQRQALCYQCHAPRAERLVGSGDDRTPMGVHEGISCVACHQGHNESARASCATCHPKMSNCGLDVEKMDTTFANLGSRHNVHFVKCVDCHEHGVPVKKVAQAGD